MKGKFGKTSKSLKILRKLLQVFESILNHFDVISVLPTGYGKSCLFQFLPGFLQQANEKVIVIVMCHLLAQ